ncbi:MAG TPA: hypothetical protein VM820_10015 [Vicinamibacterales bacterium]|nr:hypothetical protein [Vicinamibacterales bacterium]
MTNGVLIADGQGSPAATETLLGCHQGGHDQAGDLMVHLPKQRILFMSEAYLNRVFPAMRSAYPSEWVGVVDKALAMDVDRYVPATVSSRSLRLRAKRSSSSGGPFSP